MEEQLSRMTDFTKGCYSKGNTTKAGHNYLPLYDLHFGKSRTEVRSVLEIGCQSEDSIQFFKSYFPNAIIHSIDIDPSCKQYQDYRTNVYIGDERDYNFMSSFNETFDVIIDDGLHIQDCQINNFRLLFEKNLDQNGIYIVEDLESRFKSIEYFKTLVDHVNFWPDGVHAGCWPSLNSLEHYTENYITNNIVGISFYRFICFIYKGKNPQSGEAAFRISK